MKTTMKFLLSMTVTAAFSAAIVKAADDGIAASPRVRQMLDEHNAIVAGPPTVYIAEPDYGITASPRVREMLASRRTVTAPATVVVVTTTARNDGIAASPRVRQMMEDRGTTFEVAPIK